MLAERRSFNLLPINAQHVSDIERGVKSFFLSDTSSFMSELNEFVGRVGLSKSKLKVLDRELFLVFATVTVTQIRALGLCMTRQAKCFLEISLQAARLISFLHSKRNFIFMFGKCLIEW
jgi:hypothetical protein